MFKHRIAFMGGWVALTLLLLVFPGFEVKGLVFGMVIGYWPALISRGIYESQHDHPILFLLMMVILSGATVGVLAWVMDKARMTKRIWMLPFVLIITGGAVLANKGLSYEQWKVSSQVQMMEASGASYQPNRMDFNREILIPRTLAGGMWGLYGGAGLCALGSVAILLKRKIYSRRQQ